DRGRRRGQLGPARDRIRLVRQQSTIMPGDFVLVESPFLYAGRENFPYSAFRPQAHAVPPPLPAVEIAHNGYPAGVGRPDSESGAGHAIDRAYMRPKTISQVLVTA